MRLFAKRAVAAHPFEGMSSVPSFCGDAGLEKSMVVTL